VEKIVIAFLGGALIGYYLGKSQAAAAKSSVGFAGHFAMPGFMMPQMYDDATRLLDPSRG
jgi:hypothetical protein